MSQLDRPESGKRRSFAQRVGTDGELAFRLIASSNGLIPTKVEEDFGTDFWCQIDLDHESRRSSAISTTVIGACVRATTSSTGTVYLSPGDARNLLSSGTPMVFVLVHLTAGAANSPVYHRLVDEQFISEMQAFLKSGHTRMEVGSEQCRGMVDFRDSVDQMLEHGYSNRVQVAVAEAGVNTVLPNTNVHVRTGATGQLTWVSTVDYYSLFERLDDDQERQLLHAAFGSEEHTAARLAELRLRSDVIDYLTSLPQPLVFSGFSQEMTTALRVIRDKHNVIEPFTYRAIGTHSAYVHDVGISLIFSEARNRDGQMVHETELYVDPDVSFALETLESTLDFFALLSDGAKVYRRDDDPSSRSGFDIGELFPALEGLAAMIEGWRTCTQLDGWPGRSVEFRDFTNPDAHNTIVGFARILGNADRVPVSSIVFGTYDSIPEGAQLERKGTTVVLPVVGNLRHHSVILHLTVAGTALIYNGETVALEFSSIIEAEYEVRDRVEKSTPYPEIIAGPGIPTQCFGRDERGTVPGSLSDLRLGWTEEEGSPAGEHEGTLLDGDELLSAEVVELSDDDARPQRSGDPQR